MFHSRLTKRCSRLLADFRDSFRDFIIQGQNAFKAIKEIVFELKRFGHEMNNFISFGITFSFSVLFIDGDTLSAPRTAPHTIAEDIKIIDSIDDISLQASA